MALPSAQLGSLPGMYAPSAIPVYPYTKEPKAWEKALLAMATSIGGNIVSHGVENYMQPDYAPDPATGFSKFWNGPTISQSRAGTLEQEGLAQERIDEQARQDRLQNMLTRTGQQQQSTRDYLGATGDVNREIAAMQGQQQTGDIESARLANEAADRKLQGLIAEANMRRQGALAGAQTKDIQAQTAERTAGTRQTMTRDWMARHGRAPTPQDLDAQGNLIEGGGGGKTTNPNIAKFAQGSAPQGVDPKILARLQDTQRYPTAEQILSQMGGGGVGVGGFTPATGSSTYSPDMTTDVPQQGPVNITPGAGFSGSSGSTTLSPADLLRLLQQRMSPQGSGNIVF